MTVSQSRPVPLTGEAQQPPRHQDTRSRRPRRNARRARGAIIPYVFLTILAAVSIFPFLWIVVSSFKSGPELASDPLSFWPKNVTLSHYSDVLVGLGFLTNLKNSLIIAISTTVLAVAVSAAAAYGIVRFFPRIGDRITRILITTYMFPPILLAIPYSVIIAKLGLINTYAGVVIAYLSFSIPYAIWLLTAFYRTVPIEIEESAQVDGAGKFRVFLTIATPIVKPGIVATAILTFINAFNEFLYALLFINDTSKMPVAVGLYSLKGTEVLDWGAVMAASVIVVVPSIIFFISIQKYIASGLSEGSVK